MHRTKGVKSLADFFFLWQGLERYKNFGHIVSCNLYPDKVCIDPAEMSDNIDTGRAVRNSIATRAACW